MSPADAPSAHRTPAGAPPRPTSAPTGDWGAWLALTWFVLVLLAAVAEWTGWENLRLALTF